MHWRGWGVFVASGIFLGCGGGAPEAPKTADDVASSDDSGTADADAEEETADESEEVTADDDQGEEAGAAATDEDVQKVLQLVIDDPSLDPYLHLEEPGRFPLKIAGKDLPTGIELVKATQPVEVVDVPDEKGAVVIVFTRIDVSAKKATIKFRYPVEGLRGTAVLDKGQYGWELTNSRQVEYSSKRGE